MGSQGGYQRLRSTSSGSSSSSSSVYSTSSADPSTPLLSKYEKTVSYVFTGKLALFPLTILFLATGAGSLLLFGNKPYSGGYFHSEEVYYGLAGVVLSGLCITLIVFLFAWLVVKITFTLSPHQDRFIIEKRGVFRSSKLEFVLSETTLHYFRSHFSEEYAWLGLVVKERQQFFKVFSWKGRGNQRDRFHRLFQHLQDELIRCQSLQHQQQQRRLQVHSTGGLSLAVLGGLMYWTRDSTEIISKQEFTLIGPFSTRLRQLLARQTGHLLPSDQVSQSLTASSELAARRTSLSTAAEAGLEQPPVSMRPTIFSTAASLGLGDSKASSKSASEVEEPLVELLDDDEYDHNRNATANNNSTNSGDNNHGSIKYRRGGSSMTTNANKTKQSAMKKSASLGGVGESKSKKHSSSLPPPIPTFTATGLPPIPPAQSSSSRPLCIEDIPIFNYDTFFGHFRFKRQLSHSKSSGRLKARH